MPTPEDIFDLTRTTLSNGFRAWTHARPGTGTVALRLVVPVGSRHETRQNNGVSHFLEHMLFTGTARWPEHEVSEIIRRRGGEVNAYTGVEETVYWLHLPAGDLDLGLDWLAEILFRSTLAPEKFEKERRVIITEKGGQYGRFEALYDWIEDRGWGWSVFRAVSHRLYPDSPLLLPTIGKDASLTRLTRDDLLAFYGAHYLPNNMTVVAVGDVTPQAVEAAARAHFGGIPPGPLPARPVTPPDRPGDFHLRLRGPGINEQGQILLGAPIPGLGHPDRWALTLLAEMLETRLTRDIRYQRGLVYGVNANPSMYTDVGYFEIYTTAESVHFPEILAEVEGQLAHAIAGQFTEAELDEARAALRGRMILNSEGNADQASWLASISLYTREDQPLPNAFTAIERVTLADVGRVARAYLAPHKRFSAIHRPGFTPARLRLPALTAAGLASAGLALWLLRRARPTSRHLTPDT
ncbi:MAG: insulinase family protein [Chloroflexi bacterium]|nr:insulinase family protein [Chloroflexota bacterium]